MTTRRRYLRDVDAVQVLAGVADQDNECPNGTVGCPGPDASVSELPCSQCFLEGGGGE